jgi:hypothetical protein
MRSRVEASFSAQSLVPTLGAELVYVEEGEVHLLLPSDPSFGSDAPNPVLSGIFARSEQVLPLMVSKAGSQVFRSTVSPDVLLTDSLKLSAAQYELLTTRPEAS